MVKKIVKSKFLIQMMKSYSIVLITITFIFTVVLYWLVQSHVENSNVQYQNELTQKTTGQVDDFLGRMDDIANRVTSDTDTVVLFAKLSNTHNTNNFFKDNVVEAIDIGSDLKTINGSTSPVWRINVYNQYGDFISSGAITNDNSLIESKLKELNVSDLMMNLKYSNRLILSPQKDKWSSYFKSKYISLIRPITSKYGNNNVYAVVEVQEDVSSLESIIKSDNKNIQIHIYDKNNNLIISEGSIPSNSKNLKTTYKSDISGWKIEITTKSQNNLLYSVAAVFILIYIIVIAFILLVIYIIASKITRPLEDLRLEVKKVSATNISIKTNEGVIDEIKELSDAFSDVLIRIGDAAEEEKKAYLLAMQAQMNPHFLFNTLSVISASGMEAGSQKIVNMCMELSDIMRYVASYENSVVPLKDEVEHTRNYVKLMEARFEECFKCNISVDDKVMEIMVPKLILQPLVENCFKDAFSEAEPPWKININIGIEDDCFYIEVKDNGSGISEEKLNEIYNKIDNFSENIEENYRELKIGGLGLVSIISRIRLSCDSEAKYSIESSESGTSIIIKCKMKES